MLRVLKSVPGVSEEKIGFSKSDGLPFLEYQSAEQNRWTGPTRFFAEKSRGDDGYIFTALVPGMTGTPGEELDNHVTDEVLKRWKSDCEVTAFPIMG